MTNKFDAHDAMHRWSLALEYAPHILEGGPIEDPDAARRMADSSATLHGLLTWLRQNCPAAQSDAARLEWNIELLRDAAALLYRDLGLTRQAALERVSRLSGAMMGTAQQMDGGAIDAWTSLRPTGQREERAYAAPARRATATANPGDVQTVSWPANSGVTFEDAGRSA